MCIRGVTLLLVLSAHALALEPIPDNLVVLTFDDASKSHVTVAAPLLKQHGFGATFFVTEGFDFPTNKRDYLTWDEIARLNKDGFEIGNHTRDHKAPSAKDPRGTREQIEAINARCQEHGIPRPVTFAYPGNALDRDVLPLLRDCRIKFARRGGAPEFPYDRDEDLLMSPAATTRSSSLRRAMRGPPGRSRTSSGPCPRPGTAKSPSSSSMASPTRRLVGQYAEALVRVVRRVPRQERLQGDRPPRPRPVRRPGSRARRPLARHRGAETAASSGPRQGVGGAQDVDSRWKRPVHEEILPERQPLDVFEAAGDIGKQRIDQSQPRSGSRSVPSGRTALLSRTRRLEPRRVAIRAAIESVVTSQLAGSRSA